MQNNYWNRPHIIKKLQEQARDFWQEKLVGINAFGTMDRTTPEDYSYRSFIEKVKKGEITKRDPHDISPVYDFIVKPSLPWKKIDRCLKGLEIEIETKDLVILILKPFPLEKDLAGVKESEIVKRLEENICSDFNNRIKKLSPLSKQLQNLTREEPFRDSLAFKQAIEKIEFEIRTAKEIVKCGLGIHRNVYLGLGLNKALSKSPQKHEFWNLAVSAAVVVLNEYYHTHSCSDDRRCSTTHEGAIRKTAELLKILYPRIWKEDVSRIAKRIKQKHYRSLA